MAQKLFFVEQQKSSEKLEKTRIIGEGVKRFYAEAEREEIGEDCVHVEPATTARRVVNVQRKDVMIFVICLFFNGEYNQLI